MLNFTNRDVFFFVRNGPKSLCSISKSFAHFSETPTHPDAISMLVILRPIPNPNEVCCWLGRLGVQSQNHGAQVSVLPTTYETNICAEISSMFVSVRCVKLGVQAAVRINHGRMRTTARIIVDPQATCPHTPKSDLSILNFPGIFLGVRATTTAQLLFTTVSMYRNTAVL